MHSKLLALVALTFLTSAANAQSYEETRCRSDASVYSAPATGRGTATGFLNDYVVVFDCYGNLVFFQTVQWCINHPGNPYIYQTAAHSGGQYSVRLNLYKFASIKGGTYALYRAGKFVDMDAIV